MAGADDAASATEIAKQLAKANEDTNEEGRLELNEKKAAYLFAGLRKLIEVEYPNSGQANELSGLELNYSQFEVDTLEEVFSLARGEMVNVVYRE